MENTNLTLTNIYQKTKKRIIGLDILKVLSMFFIIIHHVSKHGGFFENSTGCFKIILSLSNALFMPSVNIFVFVSAYIIVNSGKFKIKNLIKLYFQVLFYSVLTYLFVCLLNYHSFSILSCIKLFFPLSDSLFWFVREYLIMYILSPLLLIIVKNLSKKEFNIFILVILAVLIYSKLNNNFEVFPLKKGFSALWFCILFLFAGYQERFSIKLNKIWLAIAYILSTIIMFLCIYYISLDVDYTNLFVIIQTFTLFNILYDVEIKNKFLCSTITYISTCTFGIYLLHDGTYIQTCLYSKILKTHNYFNLPSSVLYFILYCITILIVGIIVESIRKLIVNLLNLKRHLVIHKTNS